jgi:hypothetical protein
LHFQKLPHRKLQIFSEHLLTAWNRVLEKLIVAQLVNKFPAFCWTGGLIPLFTRVCYWSYPQPDESTLAWAKNTLWACPCLSVRRVFPTGVGNLHAQGSLLGHIVAQQWNRSHQCKNDPRRSNVLWSH